MQAPIAMPLFLVLLFCGLLASQIATAEQHETTLAVRFVSLDRSFEDQSRDRRQTGTGVILRHTIQSDDGRFNFGVAGYAAQNWSSSGSPAEDVFKGGTTRARSFSQIGEVYLDTDLISGLSLRVGRLQHESLLLRSKTRALPSTFQGLHLNWGPEQDFRLYGAWFNKWSRRANDGFTNFSTDLSEPNNERTIDWVALAGLETTVGQVELTAEALESSDFIRKAGLVAKSDLVNRDNGLLKGEAGVFISRDAGERFESGANEVLDLPPQPEEGRLKHRGFGYYLRLLFERGPHRFEIARSKFNEPWLEDSFADDHGTTPFPTRTFGPELTNSNEQVWLLGYRYRVASGVLRGLSANLKFANGSGAENSFSKSLGSASEEWALIDLRYEPPGFKHLKIRLLHRDYQSNISGNVAGVKSDRDETRFFIDYEHRF